MIIILNFLSYNLIISHLLQENNDNVSRREVSRTVIPARQSDVTMGGSFIYLFLFSFLLFQLFAVGIR